MAAQGVALDEFAAVAKPNRRGCWFSRLTSEQQEKVTAAHEAGYSARTIARVVTSWGVRISNSPVGEHFRHGCSCD